MAQQQQQQQHRPQPQRRLSIPHQHETQHNQSPTRKRTLEESEEWILFSPQADTASRTATSQTPRTTTQLSDFGSLETHVRSQPRDNAHDDLDEAYQPTEFDDDNAELDSLDDGLHAFQHNPFSSSSINQLDQSGGAVLPTHDGLGTFSAPGLQQQLWQFERYNPHRRRGTQRTTSLQKRIDEVGEELELPVEDERIARIESWRLEQSRAVLEELEKETRRRRRKLSRMGGRSADARSLSLLDASASDLRDSIIREEGAAPAIASKPDVAEPSESWWARITRRVIREIIGLDDTTLSVIFGEQLPDQSPTPTQASPLAVAAEKESSVVFNDRGYAWELRLLERITRELGLLVHQLSHEHDSAFTAYDHNNQSDTASETAAVPVPTRELAPRQPSLRQQRRRMNNLHASSTLSEINFQPTLASDPLSPATEADKSLWGIEEEPDTPAAVNQTEEDYWERDIDVHTVFTYLRRRLTRNSPPPPRPSDNEHSGPLPAAWATAGLPSTASALGTSPESLARAESIRRQHPLVHRAAERAAAQNRRRESLLRRHQMAALLQRTRGSSCASHSTKRSRRTLSGSSSRHYWDLGGGGSLESEAAFSSGAPGNWGEV